MSKVSKMVETYEEACKLFFGFRHPNLGCEVNPFGEYGLDAKVYQKGTLMSVEEWKFNTTTYHRLEDIGKGILIEGKKVAELKSKAETLSKNRKMPVMGVYRRFFTDAELILPITFYNTQEISSFYKTEWCEPNQWTKEKYKQEGYYIPLYAKNSDGDNFWIIKPYNELEKQVHRLILENRDNKLTNLNLPL